VRIAREDRDIAHLPGPPVRPQPELMSDTTTHRPGLLAAVARRWPLFLGVAAGVDVFVDGAGDAYAGYGEVLPYLALLYVVLAVLRRRGASWPVLAVILLPIIGLRFQDQVEPAVVALALGLAVAVWGVAHGRHRDHDFRLQVAGMAGFAALALAGLAVDPDLGRYLVAAGWLAHGAWDFVHLAKDRVVSRSYAQWCGTLDVMVGVGLIVAPLL
jgi:hypothetical protein